MQEGLNAPFTISDVELDLSRLHLGRALGFSGCPAELFLFVSLLRLPKAPSALASAATALLNAVFQAGCFPTFYASLLVTPVLKDSQQSALDTSNYHLIAVLEASVRLNLKILDFQLFWNVFN